MKKNHIFKEGKISYITLILIFIFVVALLLNIVVLASDLPFTIKGVTITEKSESTTGDITNFSADEIMSTITFHKLNDYVIYKLDINSTLNKNITILKIIDDNSNPYIEYQYNPHENKRINAKSSLDFIVKVIYKNELIDTSKRNQTNNVKFTIKYLEDNQKKEGEILINPTTGDKRNKSYIFLIISSIGLILAIIVEKKRKIQSTFKIATLIVIGIILNTMLVNASTILFNMTLKTTIGLYDKIIITYVIDEDEKKINSEFGSPIKGLETPTKDGYTFIGWEYEDGTSFNPNNPIYKDIKIIAKWKKTIPILRSYSDYISGFSWNDNAPDFHNASIRNTITSIEFIDLADTSLSVPKKVDNITVWDLSEKQNESIIAWILENGEEKKLYIAGQGGVLGNNDSSYLFADFPKVKKITFNNLFNTSMVTNMSHLFHNDRSLTELDLKDFNTNKVTDMSNMFSNCNLLKTIYASPTFVTDNVTAFAEMFLNATSLVGGNGTQYDNSFIDKSYAKIDGSEESIVGYFTDGIHPFIKNISTTSSKYSITVKVDAGIAGDSTKIDKYEFSIDGGNTWFEQSNQTAERSTYTFKDLELITNYNIMVKVSSKEGSANKIITASTLDIDKPTFTEKANGKKSTVVIDFGDCKEYKCSYIKDNNEEVIVDSKETTVLFESDGIIRAKKSDEKSTVSSAYTVNIARTLYDIIKRDATIDYIASIYSENGLTDDNKIYYYNSMSDASKSNVLFNGICWQMVRTTATGGVKLLYNGEVDENNECGKNRQAHQGYGSKSSSTLATSYKYASSYTLSNGAFILEDLYTYDENKPSELIGKYTCRNKTTSCKTLYYIESHNSGNNFTQISLNSEVPYASAGSTTYNTSNSSPAYAGFMYNRIYTYNGKGTITYNMSTQNVTLNTTRYYANSVDWNTPNTKTYNLNDAFKISSPDNYTSLVGKYLVSNSSNGSSIDATYGKYAFYIVAVDGSTAYTIRIANGEELSKFESYYTFGEKFVDNGNGTYTVSNESSPATTIKRTEWDKNRSKMAFSNYLCLGSDNTCSNLYQIVGVNNNNLKYVEVGFVYGNDVEYHPNNPDGEKYVLTNKSAPIYDWVHSYNTINSNKTHYTCFNKSGKCDQVYYINYLNNSNSMYQANYISLNNGEKVEDALKNMFSAEDVNKESSSIKSAMDLWYKEKMFSKTAYLEDTEYCNNRSIRSLGGWNKESSLFYPAYFNIAGLSCENVADRFTVSPDNGNGKLTYPVGLLSYQEAYLLGLNARKSGFDYWTMSPYYLTVSGSYGKGTVQVAFILANGNISMYHTNYEKGLRPVVSMKPNTYYKDGNGSYETPYIIE